VLVHDAVEIVFYRDFFGEVDFVSGAMVSVINQIPSCFSPKIWLIV